MGAVAGRPPLEDGRLHPGQLLDSGPQSWCPFTLQSQRWGMRAGTGPLPRGRLCVLGKRRGGHPGISPPVGVTEQMPVTLAFASFWYRWRGS